MTSPTLPLPGRGSDQTLQRFVAVLTEALRPLGDPIEIQDVATRLLGEFLQVSRVAYGEVTSDDVHMDYERNYVAEGVQVIAGRFRMADYGTELLAALRRGEALVEPDIAHSAVLSPAERAAYASLSIAALVGFPLIKDGRFVANLAVHHQQPRAWSADDVAAIAETTERTWEAVSRARAEAALRLSEAKYRVLFDTIEEGVVLHEFVRDASGTVVDARYTDSNRALQLLTGLQPALLIGRLVSEVNPTDFPYWLPLLQRVATGEIIRTEHFNPDFGRWFESTLYPDGSERVIGLFRDIDARKRAEAALQASEEWHRLAMESGRVVTWSWDLRARQVRGEPAFFALWGLPTPTDSLPVEAFTARLSADHAAAIEAVMARSVASGEQFDGELYITTGPTAGHWLRWRGRAHGETPWKLTGVSFDITAERQAEEQLRAAHAQLEQRVRERTQQVRMLFRRLVSVQEEERRKLARDLHDQLGQQMTALRMGLEDIAGRAASARDLGVPLARTQRIADDIDRTVDLLTRELRPAALDHFGLAAALRQLVHDWSDRFGITADFMTDHEEVGLPAEAQAHLYRIAQEALHNVVKHAKATHVSVVLVRRDREIVLVIEDDGCGFDPAAAPADAEASGLGLMSMRERATLAGGSLAIESAPGQGTAIYVHVPPPQPDAAPQA